MAKGYWITCVNQTRAKLVVCFSDNDKFFQEISIIDLKRKYFFIQNGMRISIPIRETRSKGFHWIKHS